LIFENIAISDNGEKRKFYRLIENSDPELPSWYDGLGSFSKKTVLKHEHAIAIPNIRQLIIEEDIETMTFSDLLAKYSFYDVNLIHIDVEGYDYEVIKTIDLSKLEIDIIIFEHKHLCDSDHQQSQKILIDSNFNLYSRGGDTVAVAQNIDKVLRTNKSWKQIAAHSVATSTFI